MSQTCIDVFCHCLPSRYCRAVQRVLKKRFHMFDRLQQMAVMVDLEARFRVMDRFPGYQQIPSLASPPIEILAGPDQAPELARIANEEMAGMVALHPDRFPGFVASLPLNDPQAALQEAARAIDELGALGLQVYTNINGAPIDSPEILAILELAAERCRAVWLHPARSMFRPDYPTEQESKFDLWWALGWPYETSLAMARLVFAGVFDDWPELVIITHHVGGMIPMMEGRLGSGLELLGTRNPPQHADAVKTRLKETPLRAFRRFYADTASFGSRAAIECGLAFFGSDRLLFASDMPFDPEQGPGYIRETLRALAEMDLTQGQHRAILSATALRLLLSQRP